MERILNAITAMQNEITASRTEMTEAITALKDDIAAGKEEMTAAIASSREETNAAISAVKDDVTAMKDDFIAMKDEIAASREKTSTAITAVKNDITAVKEEISAVDARFNEKILSVEESFQKQMAQLRKEVTVTTFAPAQNVFASNASNPIVKLSTFDGKTGWSVYRTQLEMVATANGWDDATSAILGQFWLHHMLRHPTDSACWETK